MSGFMASGRGPILITQAVLRRVPASGAAACALVTGLAAVACPGGAGVTADATRRAAARIVDRCPRKPVRGFRGLRSTIMRDLPQPALQC